MGKLTARAIAVGIFVSLVMFTAASLSGCTTISNPAARPAGCEDSIIYDAIPNPEVLDSLLVVAAFELARLRPEYCQFMDEALAHGEKLLSEPGLTYLQFAVAMAESSDWVNKYAGTELVILSELVSKFDRPIPMSECDRKLILAHLAKQRRYLAIL